jgi:hypothetical protein
MIDNDIPEEFVHEMQRLGIKEGDEFWLLMQMWEHNALRMQKREFRGLTMMQAAHVLLLTFLCIMSLAIYWGLEDDRSPYVTQVAADGYHYAEMVGSTIYELPDAAGVTLPHARIKLKP